MFCSTIIPTVNRTTLSRAVYSVLNQEFNRDEFEVIVVNDSGQPLPKMDWQQSDRVQVINTNRRERSVARNAGAAIAKGRYLHFLDDDDWILPGALENLWILTQTGDASWVYGGSQLVDRTGQPLIQLHHGLNGNCFTQIMAGEWIPLQTSLFETKMFFSVGGFNPLIPATEDIDLCRRVALKGDMVGTSELIACISMGVEGSSTDYARAAKYSRWAREKILNEPNVFSRMRKSASSNHWCGRMVRVYLTSIIWNLQNGNILTAGNRATFSLASFALASRRIFSKDFWLAVATSYESETFLRGFLEANLFVERRNVSFTQ